VPTLSNLLLTFFRPVAFSYNCTDGSKSSDTSSVTVSVSAVDDAPLAKDIAVNVGVNGTAVFTLAGSTVDGCVLSFRIENESLWDGASMVTTPRADVYTLGTARVQSEPSIDPQF
jgi:hypothetical protein